MPSVYGEVVCSPQCTDLCGPGCTEQHTLHYSVYAWAFVIRMDKCQPQCGARSTYLNQWLGAVPVKVIKALLSTCSMQRVGHYWGHSCASVTVVELGGRQAGVK